MCTHRPQRVPSHHRVTEQRTERQQQAHHEQTWFDLSQLIDGVPQSGDVENDEVDDRDRGHDLEGAGRGPTATGRTLGGRALGPTLADARPSRVRHTYFLAVPADWAGWLRIRPWPRGHR